MRATKFLVLLSLALLLGCSEEAERDNDSGVPTEGGVVDQTSSGPGLTGTVKDAKGVPVEGVQVEAGGQTAYTIGAGVYTLDKLTPGQVTVQLTRDWFQDKSESATVESSGMTTLDITIEEHPMKIEAEDRTLAEGYIQNFDWTTDSISIVILPKPSRKELDNAIYYRNPALYRDTSSESQITPAPLPAISGGTASDFSFLTAASIEALDNSTIADTLADTPLTAAEQGDWMMFKPMLSWLTDWDMAKIQALTDAGVAVRQQTWGDSSAIRPQDIEQAYLHGKEIWVQVVFENYINLGSGITDSDGDGRKEIYARIATEHYTDELIDTLTAEYIAPTYDTHGMSQEINKSLNELYSKTAAEVEKYIGQPFDVPDVGQIKYPFVVLSHSGNQKNVLLVGP